MKLPNSPRHRLAGTQPRPPDRSGAIGSPGWGPVFLCVLHGIGVWVVMGGRSGIASDWPILLDDHGIHYEHGLMARQFLRTTGMNAGYDPNFMSGYPLSIVSDLSSTLSDLVMAVSGNRPALGYKLYVFGCTAAFPWLIGLIPSVWKLRAQRTMLSGGSSRQTSTSGPTYPTSSLPWECKAICSRSRLACWRSLGSLLIASRGGFGRWLWSASYMLGGLPCASDESHAGRTGGLLAWGVALFSSRKAGRAFPLASHLGLWLMAPLILAVNSFWLVPGIFLASTKGASDSYFAHSREGWIGVLERIGNVFLSEGTVPPLLLGLVPSGLIVLGRRNLVAAMGLGGFMAAGFGWGYLAGFFPQLDPLQPGRHTYACYTAASVAAGIGLAEVFARLCSARSPRLDVWFGLPLLSSGFAW